MTFTRRSACLALLALALPAHAENKPAAKEPAPLAVSWTYSSDGGKTFSSNPMPPVTGGATVPLEARGEFDLADPAALGGITITAAGASGGITFMKGADIDKMGRFRCPVLEEAKVALNGRDAVIAFPDLLYEHFLLDGKALVKGRNTLTVKGAFENMIMNLEAVQTPPVVPGFVVRGIERAGLEFQYGPVLGVAGTDFVTVTCKTNLPAVVTARVIPLGPVRAAEVASPPSPRGLFHSFRLPVPAGTRSISYTLEALGDGEPSVRKTAGPIAVTLPDFAGTKLRFAAMGQSDGGPWAKVALAAFKTRPDLVLHAGVLNYFPPLEFCWNGILPPPEVREMVSSVPFYAARGANEFANPIFTAIFTRLSPPNAPENWTQVIGPARFIFLDPFLDWAPNSQPLAWLDAVLKAANEKFVFVVCSYPAYSSARWVREPSGILLQTRNVIMPLLGRYKATALISSYGHQYERCEVPPDKGVPQIVTAASGGLTRKASGRAGNINPFSTVYVYRQHFCLFEIEGNTCTLTARGMGGDIFDTRVFPARGTPPASAPSK